MGLLGALGLQTRVQLIQNNNTVVQLDVSLNETHSRESPATEFPVEDGTSISDHVIIKPFQLELHGLITDTPLGTISQLLTEVATTTASALLPPTGVIAAAGGAALLGAIANAKSPSVAAYLSLINLQSMQKPVDVLTSLHRYPSMWITSISAPRSVEIGKALEFTAKLSQLILVQPQSVNIQIFSNPALSANQGDLGQQGTGIPNGFQQGFNDTNSAISAVTGGPLG